MAYNLTEDLKHDKEFNLDDLDAKMQLCLNRISGAFSGLKNHAPNFASSIEAIFQAFGRTQKSIQLLLKQTRDDPNFASDAMSLVREQIEKIYIIALMLDEPSKWIQIYFKDDWRRLYKYEVLLNVEERKNLTSYTERNYEVTATSELMRRVAKVTDDEKELITHRHNSPGVAKPAHLAGVDIPIFPMPKEIIDKISDANLKNFLSRWHKEYEFICGYSHVGLEKMFVNSLSQSNKMSDGEKKTVINDVVIVPTMILSYLAMASACSVAWSYLIKHDSNLKSSAEFLDATMQFWDEMQEFSLLGKVFWNIYVKDVFPHIIGK